MINSRYIKDLTHEMQELCNKFIAECIRQQIEILITSTYRDFEAQNALYNQKPKVTNAKGGDSFHNYRLAFDVVPLDAKRKPVWNDDKLWQQIGNIGESVGLAWGGRFKTFPDKPHFQKAGITIHELKHGFKK